MKQTVRKISIILFMAMLLVLMTSCAKQVPSQLAVGTVISREDIYKTSYSEANSALDKAKESNILSANSVDAEQMIEAYMSARQKRYNEIYKEVVRNEWLKEAYADIYSEINKFVNSTLTKYKIPETFAPMYVTSSDEDVVTAVANADALLTSHFVCVKQLAEKATTQKDASGETISTNAVNAIVTIDGIEYVSDSNKVQVDGVTYSLIRTGGDDYPIFVTVAMDMERAINNAKTFAEDYNKMLDRLYASYKEETYSDYDVLTKEQEKEMSGEEIKAWNEKAKSGLLRQNTTLSKMIKNMRSATMIPVESIDSHYNTVMSLGLVFEDSAGHLGFDEDNLMTALRKDKSLASQIFCAVGDESLSSSKKYNATGVANRLYDSAQDILEELKKYGGTTASIDDGSYLGNLILNTRNKLDAIEEVMNLDKNRMYEKADVMQERLNELNGKFQSLGLDTGSVITQGHPEIVFGVGGLAVGFVIAMLIFRKKKSGPVNDEDTANDEKE